MTKLRFAPALTLPLDVVTQRLGFLGRIGSGKTYASTKLAELMLDAGAQMIALDPVGVWYGLRVDGKGKGYPIPVFGGLHGDVPLEPTAGAMIADLVIDRRLSCVIDVSQFEHDTDKARFAAAFAKRFYFRKKAAPSAVHLFIEECQEFIPQQPAKGEEQMLHAFTRMAKLGRNFGIGISLNSQRPQEVSKKVLNLTECLFSFQMTGAHERKAIKEWIATVGADENILTVLPQLPVGVAHVYSPQWLRISEQVKCYEKRSADVSSTPAVDAAPVDAKPLTPVDLGKIREAMAATIEKAKQDDPTELKREIARLKKEQRELSDALDKQTHAPALAKTLDEEYARGFADGGDTERKRASRILSSFYVADGKTPYGRVHDAHREMLNAVNEWHEAAKKALQSADGFRADFDEAIRKLPKPIVIDTPPRSFKRIPPSQLAVRADVSGLPPGAQKLLDAAARLAAVGVIEPTRTQLAALAGVSSTSSTTDTNFGKLTKGGFLEVADAGAVRLTGLGERHAKSVDKPPTLEEYHEEWRRILGHGAERKLFDAYLDHQGSAEITRTKLNELAGISSTSSTTDTAYGRLTGLELFAVAGAGKVKGGRTMFPEGLD